MIQTLRFYQYNGTNLASEIGAFWMISELMFQWHTIRKLTAELKIKDEDIGNSCRIRTKVSFENRWEMGELKNRQQPLKQNYRIDQQN